MSSCPRPTLTVIQHHRTAPHTMNTLPLLIAALVMLPAIGVMLWAWSTMQRAENDLRVDAGLEHGDFDIGTWPSSSPASLT
jgi:hypothetical protein